MRLLVPEKVKPLMITAEAVIQQAYPGRERKEMKDVPIKVGDKFKRKITNEIWEVSEDKCFGRVWLWSAKRHMHFQTTKKWLRSECIRAWEPKS